MLTQLITETLLGALTGYITNDTAIRSLFKPNGVIEQTRDDFAREAGELLESQVLTPIVLEQQLQLPQVQEALRAALHHFLHQALPHTVEHMTIKDLPDSDTAIQYVQEQILQFAKAERETILHNLNKHFDWETLFTKEQSESVARMLEQTLLHTMQQEQFAQRLWQSWSGAQGTMTMEELGLDALCDTIMHNLARESAQWMPKLSQQYGTLLQAAAQESISQLQLDPVLLELDQQMESMTLGQYLNCDANELALALTQLLQSREGRNLIEHLAAEILHALSKVDIPLQQLIPSDVMDDTVPILQQQLPQILTQLLDWVWDNKQSVQRMLEEAVDEIAAETGGMKGMLLEQLKSSLLGELMQSSDTYSMLLELVSGDNTTDQTVDYLMYKLTDLLTDNTVGQLIVLLNANGKLQIALQAFLYENAERYLTRSGSEALHQLLNWCPGSLHLYEHKEDVETLLVNVLLLAAERIDLPALISKSSETITTMPITKLLAMDTDVFDNLMQKCVQKACRYAADTLPYVPSGTVYNTLYDAALWWLEQSGAQSMAQVGGQVSLQKLIHTAANAADGHIEQLIDILTETGLTLLKGRLSILAQEQIQSLSSEEMLELVEDFMGRELQPLNYLGAGMGAAAGATVGMALSTAIPAVSLSAPLLAGSVLAGKAAVFGAVGYTTNCAAVKGLFWPYEPVAGIRTIQGVIPKQKERFAGSMGRLVDRYVINDEILHQQIDQLQQSIRAQHTAGTLASNAQLFERLSAELAIERRRITEPACQAITDYGLYKSGQALHSIGQRQMITQSGEKALGADTFHTIYETLLPKLETWITAQMHTDTPLDAILSAESLWQWVAHAAPQVALPDLSAMAQELLHSQRTLASVAGEDYTRLKEQLQHSITDYLAMQKSQAQMAHAIMQVLSGEQLHQWITTGSSTWIADNLTMLFHWIETILLELLHKRQDSLTNAIEQEILNRMGLMTRMGYAMMNGSAIVAAIVDRLLHQKLPIFLSVKRKELESMLYRIWEEQLSPAVTALSAKYITTDTTALLHTAVRTLLAEPAVQHAAVQMAVYTLDTATNVPIKTWGSYLNVPAILARPQLQLGYQWQTHSREIVALWQQPVCVMADHILHNTTLAQLCRGYQQTFPLIRTIHSDAVEQVLAMYTNDVIAAVAITKINDWCHWDQMSDVLHGDITALLKDSAFQSWMHYEAELMVLTLAAEPDRLLPVATREVLITSMIQAVFDTAEQHGTAILSRMQLSALAEVQLKQMDSAHLEQVVRGFAGHYLVHIQNRGCLGAVFALPGMLLYLI